MNMAESRTKNKTSEMISHIASLLLFII